MSTNASEPRQSAAADKVDLAGVVRVIRDSLPGVVTSVMAVANVLDGMISGVVLDADEKGGGYISEQELAPGATYLVIGVGVESDTAGVLVLDDWEAQ